MVESLAARRVAEHDVVELDAGGGDALRRAREAADRVPLVAQARGERRADVSRDARDEGLHRGRIPTPRAPETPHRAPQRPRYLRISGDFAACLRSSRENPALCEE